MGLLELVTQSFCLWIKDTTKVYKTYKHKLRYEHDTQICRGARPTHGPRPGAGPGRRAGPPPAEPAWLLHAFCLHVFCMHYWTFLCTYVYCMLYVLWSVLIYLVHIAICLHTASSNQNILPTASWKMIEGGINTKLLQACVNIVLDVRNRSLFKGAIRLRRLDHILPAKTSKVCVWLSSRQFVLAG